ncbi:MAG: CRISPR-associated ring nuclease Csm6 [Amphritea sp.]
MSHVLLSVTGMSPAVITETLYAIHRDGLTWPDRICAITTAVGANLLQGLVDEVNRLCRDYEIPPFSSEAINVRVVTGTNGCPVSDARSVEDHEALGDFIMKEVRDITSQPGMSVHASIAGGRKTMTFYLGYAMSLFGKRGDMLSHVLVSEPFESVSEFRYPPPGTQIMESRQAGAVDARDAVVTLADIPFIRLRDSLPPAMLELGTRVSFRDMVSLINLGDAEGRESVLKLALPQHKPELMLMDSDERILKTIELRPLDYAFYRTVLRLGVSGELVVTRPVKGERDTDLAISLAEELLAMQGERSDDQLLTAMLDRLADMDEPGRISSRTLETLRPGGVNTNFFDTRCNTIKEVIERVLPPRLSRWFVLRQVADDQGARLDFYSADWPVTGKGGGYGIALAPGSVLLTD